MMTPRELIRSATERFSAAGIPDPENDAALLLTHLTGRPPLSLRLDDETALPDSVIALYSQLSARRLDRYPLQYLLGEAPFFGRMFLVDPRVLIPRPETELLCEWALDLLKDTPSPRILDLCCGSGCIGLTLKAERPDAVVTLSDISADALDVAAVNAQRISPDVFFVRTDLLDGFGSSAFDLIICNPPYIPSSDCLSLQPEVMSEPLLALDGGCDGCDLYRRLAAEAGSVLSPGGKLLMEIGIRESDYLSSLFSAYGFIDTVIRKDFGGIDRMLLTVNP